MIGVVRFVSIITPAPNLETVIKYAVRSIALLIYERHTNLVLHDPVLILLQQLWSIYSAELRAGLMFEFDNSESLQTNKRISMEQMNRAN